MRRPVVFVLEGAHHDPNFALPRTDEELARWLVPEPGSLPRGVWATAVRRPVSDQLALVPPVASVRHALRPFTKSARTTILRAKLDRQAAVEAVVNIRNLSDTALCWRSIAPASARPDAIRDPLAARLAGERGRDQRNLPKQVSARGRW